MSEFTFDGFEPSNTTPVPDVFFDYLLARLSGAEVKVLLYIIRRTRGFKKDADAISLSQFEKGITTREGKVLDEGCGLNRETICKALASLEAMGCIKTQKRSKEKEKDVTIYSIRFKGEVVGKSDQVGSRKSELPLVGKVNYPSRKIRSGVVGKSDLQETVIQETVIQETVIQRDTVVSATQNDASLTFSSSPQSENGSHSSAIETSSQSQNSTSLSEVSLEPPAKAENASVLQETDNSTPTLENGSPVAISQASSEIRIAPTKKKNVVKKTSTSQHHPDLGKWYGMFNETSRELGKREGIPANFAIPSQKNYTEAFESMIEAGATLEQGKWILTSIWNDPDPFWKNKRTPTAMRSQYTARISRMPRNLHIVPEQTPPISNEPIDPTKPVERWTHILEQREILRLSLEDRKAYFVWKNAQRKVS